MSLLSSIDAAKRAISRGGFPYQFSWVLELPWRVLVLSPQRHASILPVSPDARVLELGAGAGYYSVEVARRIPAGRLELFDLQPEMLYKCRAKLSAAGQANVGYTTGDAAALPFADAQFDVAYLVTVLGEIRDQDACLFGIRRVLKPGGVLSISEHLPDPDFIRFGTLRQLAERNGFALERRHGSRLAYTATFRTTSERLPDRRVVA